MSFWGDKGEVRVLNCPAPSVPTGRGLGKDQETQFYQVYGHRDLFQQHQEIAIECLSTRAYGNLYSWSLRVRSPWYRERRIPPPTDYLRSSTVVKRSAGSLPSCCISHSMLYDISRCLWRRRNMGQVLKLYLRNA